MNSFKVLKEEEIINEISMDELKGGLYPADDTGECCKSNTACNVNSSEVEVN